MSHPDLQTAARSPHWPTVRRAHLAKEPKCRACGGTCHLNVHHIKPFHLFPELELVQTNLITLCEHPSHNCHEIFGHLLDWSAYNVSVRADASRYLKKVETRPYDKKAA